MSKRRTKPPRVNSIPKAARQSRATLLPPAIWLVCAGLLALTFVVYWPVHSFGFVNYDDPEYVTNNLHLINGITPEAIRWAFTSAEAANWFPLTRLSQLIDYQVFGPSSGPQHLMNVAIHALAALALLGFLYRATRQLWASTFVAVVFALHPLHVESVAWISERKDVLSALFWFLTLWVYVIYAERSNWRRYVLTLFLFACALTSKPMAVTLPFALLLLDFWPLRRLRPLTRSGLEKVPFLILSMASIGITYAAQRQIGAMKKFAVLPIGLRIENAVISYATYIAKSFWPSGLAVFYPYPEQLPVSELLLAIVLLVGISYLAWTARRSYPYVTVGWLWFLGTLVPVIGLIQVGGQSHADRYTYIPMVGITLILAFGAVDMARHRPQLRRAIVGAGALVCAGCAVLASNQIRVWQNTGTLFEHTLAVTHDNYVAEQNLGIYLVHEGGDYSSGLAHLEKAIRINPNSLEAHTDLGNAYSRLPRTREAALAEYRQALRIQPNSAITHYDFGSTLLRSGRIKEAIAEYQTALRLDASFAQAHNSLGAAYAYQGRFAEAIDEYNAALRLNPSSVRAHNNLGSVLLRLPGRMDEAIAQYNAALALDPENREARENLAAANSAKGAYNGSTRDPNSAEAHFNYAVTLSKIEGQQEDAVREFQAALRIAPGYALAHNNLGVTYAKMPGHERDALREFEAAVRVDPDYCDAQVNLAKALSQLPGRLPEAIKHLEVAQRLNPSDQNLQRALEQFRASERDRRSR